MKKLFFYTIFSLILSPALFAQATDNVDDLFNNTDGQIVQEAKTIDNPQDQVDEKPGLVWGGEFISIMGVYANWIGLPPASQDWLNPQDTLHLQLTGKLFFDARPNKNFRVFGKLTTDYPFYTNISTLADPMIPADSSTNPEVTWTLNNIKLFELFSDFNIEHLVFFRFGKQTAHWGLSRFYQVADPLSLAVKDPEKPEEDLEGPLALKVTIPFGLNNLYLYSVAKTSYLPGNMLNASFRDLGYGVKADFFLPVPKNPVLSSAELNIGTYYQRNLAPKLVTGISTGIWKFDIFSDQVFSWGLDNYRLTDLSDPLLPTEKATNGLFYAMTAGIMYNNSDWNLTIYGEYLFKSYGSTDPNYMEKLYARYLYELGQPTKTITASDLFTYPSQQNTAFSATLSELFGNEKLAASLFWQANWNDLSGLIIPSIIFKINDYFNITAGARLAYGNDNTEFVLKSMNLSGTTLQAQRCTLYIDLTLGSGKF